MQRQPSRAAIAGKFFFYVAVAPVLLGLAFIAAAALLA